MRPRASAETIVQAAERLFSERGYHKATVAALAEGLGMSPANVYRFFHSKEDLRRAVVSRILDASYAMALSISRRPIDAASRIKRCLKLQHRITMDIVAHHGTMHELITLSLDQDRGLFDGHIARLGDLLASVIADGIESEEFAARDVQAISRIFIMATAKVWHPKLLSNLADGSSDSCDLVDFTLCALRDGTPPVSGRAGR